MANVVTAIGQWLNSAKGKIIAPKTLTKYVFDENGKSVEERFTLINTDAGNTIDVTLNKETYEMTVILKNKNGEELSSKTVDFPMELAFVNASYVEGQKKITFTLQSGAEVEVPLAKLIEGLVNTEDFNAAIDEIKTQIGKYTNYIDTDELNFSENGIDVSRSTNGKIFVLGTATADTEIQLVTNKMIKRIYANVDHKLKLVGCPPGGSADTYYLYAERTLGGDKFYDYGSGCEIPVTRNDHYYLYFCIKNGTTVGNIEEDEELEIHPMITNNMNCTYDDYCPYIGGQSVINTLRSMYIKINNILKRADNTDINIKALSNAIEYSYKSIGRYNNLLVSNGKSFVKLYDDNDDSTKITITYNGDGTYTLNGTTGNSNDTGKYISVDLTDSFVLKKGTYYLTGLPSDGVINPYNRIYLGGYQKDIKMGINITGEFKLTLQIGSNVTFDNAILKPMLVIYDENNIPTYDDFVVGIAPNTSLYMNVNELKKDIVDMKNDVSSSYVSVNNEIAELNSNLVALEEDCETLFCDRNILKNISHSVENNGSWRFEAYPLRLALLANPIKGFTPNRSYRIYLKAYTNNTSGVPILQVKYTDDTTDDILVKATSSTEYNLTTNASKSIKEIITSYWDNCFFYIEKLEIYGHDVGKQLTDSNESLEAQGLLNKVTEMQQGRWNISSGVFENGEYYVCSKEYISCNGNSNIKLKCDNAEAFDIVFFNGSSFISGESKNGSELLFTTPSNATSFKFNIYNGNQLTPQNIGKIEVYVDNQIDEINSNLSDLKYEEVAGGKNLATVIPFIITNNIIFTKKDDSTLIANGGNYHDGIGISKNFLAKAGITYTAQIITDLQLGMFIWNSDEKIVVTPTTHNKEITFSVTKDTNISIAIIDDSNVTFNNTEIKIQLEEGTQATPYEPYIPSVKMLAEEVSAQNNSLSVIGKCKNLISTTLSTTTASGVICTNNGDGTYTLSGTNSSSSSNVTFILNLNYSDFPTSAVKLVGCPALSESGKVILQTCYNGTWGASSLWDTGKGVILENGQKLTKIAILVYPSKNVDGIVIKPMLTTNLNSTYNDYVPYTGNSDTIMGDINKIEKDLDIARYGEFSGSKNLFDERFIRVMHFSYDSYSGNYCNEITDTRTYFMFSVSFLDSSGTGIDNTGGMLVINKSGRYSITKTIPTNAAILRIKHNGTATDIILMEQYISRMGLNPGNTITVSMYVTGINPSVQHGLSLSSIQIEKGDKMTEYERYVPSNRSLANLPFYQWSYSKPANQSAAWHKIIAINSCYNKIYEYWMCNIMITGNWYNNAKSNALFNICCINGNINIVQIAGKYRNGSPKIRVVKNGTNRVTIEIYCVSSKNAEMYNAIIYGNILATMQNGEIDSNTYSGNTVTELSILEISSGHLATTENVNNKLGNCTFSISNGNLIVTDSNNNKYAFIPDGLTPG